MHEEGHGPEEGGRIEGVEAVNATVEGDVHSAVKGVCSNIGEFGGSQSRGGEGTS